jgi:anti-sigma regulatory factor (Ser/Thr protein kinase)
MRTTLRGDLANVRNARAFTRQALSGLPVADDAALVVSELVANAVLHSASGDAGGRVQVEVCAWQGHAFVAVTDEGAPARVCVPVDGDEHGRGMAIVGGVAWWGERRVAACHQTWAVVGR